MKVFVRRRRRRLRAASARKGLADTLTVRHLRLRAQVRGAGAWQGAQHGEATFAVPLEAPLGTYEILVRDTLAPGAREPQERRAGEFRVEAFRVPLMRARLQAVGTPLVKPAAVDFDVQVSYLSGGGAAGCRCGCAPPSSRAATRFPDFEDYAFAAGNVKEGREERGDSFAGFDGNLFADPDLEDEAAASGPSPRARPAASRA